MKMNAGSLDIVYYLNNAFLCFNQILFTHICFKPKYNKYISFILYYLLFASLALSQRVIYFINPLILIVAAYAVYFGGVFLLYEDGVKYKIAVAATANIVYMGVTGVVLTYISKVFCEDVNDMSLPSILFVDSIICSIYILCFFILSRIAKRKTSSFDLFGFLIMIFGQCASGFVLLLLFNGEKVFTKNSSLISESTIGYFIAADFILYIVSDIVFLYFLNRSNKVTALSEELKMSELKNQMSYDYYKSLESDYTEIREIRHDIANIIETMKSLKENSPETMHIYQQFETDFRTIQVGRFSDNNLVNTIVSNKYRVCTEKGITMIVNISIPEIITVQEADLCKIIVNLLDNAINAAENSNEKIVEFTISHHENEIDFSSSNTFVDENEKVAKKDKNHGLGQKILSETAKKYDGLFVTEQKDNTYSAKVILKQKI